MQVKAVLFDFGGVLAEEGFREGLRALAESQGLNPDAMPGEGMKAVYDSGYVVGKGTEADFWTLMRRRTGLRGSDAILTEACLSRFQVRPSMIALVRRLREDGYVTGILSDQTDWLERLDQRSGFLKEFQRVFVSCRMSKGKRDPSLFDDVINALNVEARQVVFIDDDPGNVERARQRELISILFTNEEMLAVDLESALSAERE